MSRRLLYLEWVDSTSAHAGSVWLHDDESHVKNLLCKSVGFVVKEDKASITIAGHESVNHVSGQMTIPKCAITKRRRVMVKK